MIRPSMILLFTLLMGSELAVAAPGALQSSRSVGKPQQEQADLSQLLTQREYLVRRMPATSEDYSASSMASEFAGIANRHDQMFEIYEADVALVADLDGDGFHHAINVFFDVDVSYDDATVYAKLYLSREGGPWIQYFTTDLFAIHGDDYADAYEVESELIEGYPPGYYAVLVEIYSLDHAYMVTSAVLDYHSLGKDLAIEDLDRDERHGAAYYGVTYSEVIVTHGGGGMTTLLLFFLLIQVVIVARGTLALPPCKKCDDNNKNRFS